MFLNDREYQDRDEGHKSDWIERLVRVRGVDHYTKGDDLSKWAVEFNLMALLDRGCK